MNSEKRAELLKLLRGAGNSKDPEALHSEAEDALLALLDDAEIAEAWNDAATHWYYS